MAETQLIRCPSCAATNRVPQHKVESGLQPVCGRCTTPLSADHRPVTVTGRSCRTRSRVSSSELSGTLNEVRQWYGQTFPRLSRTSAVS
jgi:hypothetical protein